MTFPTTVNIIEVGARDGLQNEKKTLATALKIDFISQLATTGLQTIEATSFVSPKWIPQLADAKEVMQGIVQKPNVLYPVLVPNTTGMQNAIAAGAKSIAVFTAASETFSQKNTNCSIADSLENITKIIELAKQNNIAVRGYISCVLGCPYEGKIDFQKTADIAQQLYSMGCYQISLGDTIGIGTPAKATQLISNVAKQIPVNVIAAHFHDTYGQALANIYAVLEQGVNSFDSSIAGLGGCPYAHGASGNVATEDLVYMLEGMGINTGVDLQKLLKVSKFICQALGRTPNSKVALAMSQV